jgi:hypothetical protein
MDSDYSSHAAEHSFDCRVADSKKNEGKVVPTAGEGRSLSEKQN